MICCDLMRQSWGQDHPAFQKMFAALYLPAATPEQVSWWIDLQRIATAPETLRALDDRETFGRRYELCGPDVMSLKEIVEYLARIMEIRRLVMPLPNFLARLQGRVMEFVPGKPFKAIIITEKFEEIVTDVSISFGFGDRNYKGYGDYNRVNDYSPHHLGGYLDSYYLNGQSTSFP
jgi:hypothetical protein